ncbi:unnamed protein product [Diabrotica balteata]|uniref:Uncharacterized protein n=1 Tax=Diabrotica balteata TaxID=107213 RepID=A0A9N9T516_DIABA|nr:unnamed protein product [Diabrotica balteata]
MTIPSEIIKLLDDKGKHSLLSLFNKIYETGHIPADWLLSTFVMISKKINTKQCSDHRTISLMSHVLKIFLRILHSRIYNKIEVQLSETQLLSETTLQLHKKWLLQSSLDQSI